jgi:hypothetical protein
VLEVGEEGLNRGEGTGMRSTLFKGSQYSKRTLVKISAQQRCSNLIAGVSLSWGFRIVSRRDMTRMRGIST